MHMGSFVGYICYNGDWAEDRSDVCVVRHERHAKRLVKKGVADHYEPLPVYDDMPALSCILELSSTKNYDGSWSEPFARRSYHLKDTLAFFDRQIRGNISSSYVLVWGTDHNSVRNKFTRALKKVKRGGENYGEEMEAEGR
jgi:hypothetical protein